MNTQRWVKGSFVVASVFVFFVLRQILFFVWDLAKLPLYDEWVVTLPDLLAVAGAIGIYFILARQAKINAFMNDVVLELSKVTWPVPKETVASAGVVIVMVGIAAIILSIFDSLWGVLTQKLLTF